MMQDTMVVSSSMRAYMILEDTELLHILGQQEQREHAAEVKQQARVPPIDRIPPIFH